MSNRTNEGAGRGTTQEEPERQDGGFIPWDRVEEWLEQARNYWVSTARADGQTHATPVWGIWREGAFYFDTSPLSRKARNLSVDPAISVQLNDGDEAVRLQGAAQVVTDTLLIHAYFAAYAAKYETQAEDRQRLVYRLRPREASAWLESDLDHSLTTWQLPDR